jgi:hypothetical protein
VPDTIDKTIRIFGRSRKTEKIREIIRQKAKGLSLTGSTDEILACGSQYLPEDVREGEDRIFFPILTTTPTSPPEAEIVPQETKKDGSG